MLTLRNFHHLLMAVGATGLIGIHVQEPAVLVFHSKQENVIIQRQLTVDHFVLVKEPGIKSATLIHVRRMSQVSAPSSVQRKTTKSLKAKLTFGCHTWTFMIPANFFVLIRKTHSFILLISQKMERRVIQELMICALAVFAR